MVVLHDLLLLPSQDNMSAIVESVHDNFLQNYDDTSYLSCHAIVSPTNTALGDINTELVMFLLVFLVNSQNIAAVCHYFEVYGLCC